MKKILLAVLSLLAMVASLSAGQFGDFTYTTNVTVTITGYTGPRGAVDIPSAINGLPVSSIGDSAFRSCSSLTSVTIPDSVTSIGGCIRLLQQSDQLSYPPL